MSKRVVIIGGGIIGLCSAYYLQKSGHNVTVLDKSDMNSGASYVNAGYLSPSHLIPLSAPGVVKKGLKWMFNSASPLYIKPRLDHEFIKWALAFNKSCNKKHVTRSAPIIKDICLLSQELIDDIKNSENFSFHYSKRGLFMLCQTEKALEEEFKVIKVAEDLGLKAKIVNKEFLKNIEPNVVMDIIGAAYYECDHHTTPSEFMTELKQQLVKSGAQINQNIAVTNINTSDNKVINLETNNGIVRGDEFVLAAGSWSQKIAQKIGVRLLLQAGKGYRINSTRPTGITTPAILSEAKVAITPMNGFTRFAGTMEIAGINHRINHRRVDAIANAVTKYYPNILINKDEKENAACGLRPVSPDGLPYIGRSNKCANLTFATGHAMMGWSMGPATGKLVQEIIDEQKTSMDISLFNPDRKF